MRKATLEDLLTRAEQAKKDRMRTVNVDVKKLGLSLTIVKQSLNAVSKIMDMAKQADTIEGAVDVYKELIYTCCPLLHDKKLQEAYDCHEPYDVVSAVLDDNIYEIQALGMKILGLYGLDEIVQSVKN